MRHCAPRFLIPTKRLPTRVCRPVPAIASASIGITTESSTETRDRSDPSPGSSQMKKRIVIVALVVSVVTAGAAALYLHHRPSLGELVVQGNVDLRQVELPFKDNERIVEVLAQEGDRVHAGQVLARLDVERLQARIHQARAQVAVQRE